MKTPTVIKNITTALAIIVLLNIAVVSYIFNLYKFVKCIPDANCTSDTYRALAVPVFPIGILIGFIDFDTDSKK